MVSCHVERPLDDRVWAAFSSVQRRRPGGLAIAALMRPPDPEAGERDEERWLARAREAAARGPLGHHTHFTSPTHARPTAGDPGERVRREAEWLEERNLRPTLFCGGGWYTDRSVALACAELGYADCTPRASRPGYLPDGAAWAQLGAPAQIDVAGSTIVAVPTTHGAGALARAVLLPRLPARVHAYFHDTDLVARPRRALIVGALRILGLRGAATDLDALAAAVRADGHVVAWADVARGEAADPRA
ncbi:MAG TPA: hypothetical protein VH620_00965 [Gaiella sp.]